MTDELIGKTIGGYEILDVIGQGGMATVFRAYQLSMKRDVALKVLPRQFLNDDTYLQRFNREVEIVSQLEHRNIVPVYDYGQYAETAQPYIVMRYMSAGSVDDRISQGPMDIESILKIIEQIAPALDYAHSKGVLHRDLKPSNVLLDDDGGAYITDFGIARILGEQGPGITTQGVVGTPSYMSPEQAQAHSLDGRSDVYSLGVMLFEMMTGRRPFESDTPYSIAVMQVTTPPPSPRSLNPVISPNVEQVIFKALKKSPEDRHANANELAEALQMAAESVDTLHDTHPRPIPIARPAPQPAPQSAPQAAPQAVPQSVAPHYTPPTPPSTHSSVGQPPVSWRARVQKPRKNNMWLSVVFGGLIGCALLTILLVVGAIIVSNVVGTPEPRVTSPGSTPASTNDNGGTNNSPTSESTSIPAALDQTSEAARKTLIPENNTATEPAASPTRVDNTAEPTATGLAPVGVRPTATFTPLLSQATGTILYFDQQDGSFDIFTMDLRSRIITQLTADKSTNSYPAFSPDGEYVAFQSDRDGDFEIYVMTAGGGNVRQLTFNGVLDRLPTWSPDGQWIIYSSDTRGDDTYDLYRVNVAGGEIEEVFSNKLRNSHARYSPDGKYILFTSGQIASSLTWEILRLDTETGEVVNLTDNGVRDASPVFGPDGKTILYVTGGAGGAAIATMNLDGSDKEIIYDSDGFDWEADYSPDGKYIVFNSDATGRDELYLMVVDGSEEQRLTEEGGAYPSWIP